ncbi:HK97-gp10 family putative phage morphogenesis protein [Kushneria phosphatilytica]|uniref:Uncharacterized protein n=1 Tax=Kushneria phosphatilytica TaxID=657387 RepID=A0A1S1NVY6_9GAMM|nr:HK97-gp10 family putative phage morphogenesis protein [Kushneria phosphatilytica]OHV12121.1 hypothetical protein BH688_05570 [Kushneria phosphatilytica]QEL11315.1 hypothetical protein FY550_09315 [Kushneria phosphatilytica]
MMPSESVSFSIKGLSQISREFKRLPGSMQEKALRPSMRRSMDLIKRDARENAERIDDPRTPLNIADHIILNTGIDRKTGNMSARVGVRGGARYRKGDKEAGKVTYWRFVEFGTGRSRARPFLRPAMNENVESVFSTFVAEMRRSIERSI